jgi:uncharacterized protein
MTKERLQELSLEALLEIAGNEEISLGSDLSREAVIELILEEEAEEKTDRDKANNAAMRVKEKKFEIIKDDEESSLLEYELPESYNETKIMLLLRDPQWAFAYWDLKQSDIETIEDLLEPVLLLRVYQVDNRDNGGNVKTEPFEIPVKPSDRRWYINLPKTGLKYLLQLIVSDGETEKVLCESNTIESPEISINLAGDSGADEQFRTALAASGLRALDDFAEKGGIPQRIISLLDTQYLHLQG